METQTPVIQFVRNNNTIFSASDKTSTTHPIPETVLKECKNSLGSALWNDEDTIEIFTYYDDGTYFLEKKRSVYDWRLKLSRQQAYVVEDLTEEELESLKTNFLSVYQICQVNFLQKTKHEVEQQLKQQFGFVKHNLFSMRCRFLSETDWTQLPDNDLTDEQTEEYRVYRSKLRDITKTDAWLNGEYINAKFPIPPNKYHELYPNAEVAYLETEDQWNPEGIVMLKSKLLRFAHTLGLQSTTIGIDMSRLDSTLDSGNLDDIKHQVDTVLKYIDTKFEIVLKERTGE